MHVLGVIISFLLSIVWQTWGTARLTSRNMDIPFFNSIGVLASSESDWTSSEQSMMTPTISEKTKGLITQLLKPKLYVGLRCEIRNTGCNSNKLVSFESVSDVALCRLMMMGARLLQLERAEPRASAEPPVHSWSCALWWWDNSRYYLVRYVNVFVIAFFGFLHRNLLKEIILANLMSSRDALTRSA